MKRCYSCFNGINDDLTVCPFCGYIDGTPPKEAGYMSPGTSLVGRYIIGITIGIGRSCIAYIGWDAKLEHKVTIKEYFPFDFATRIPGQKNVAVFNDLMKDQFESGLNDFVNESKKLFRFQNAASIARIIDYFEENNTAYVIMEYLEGETLSERLEREKCLSEREAIKIMMPIMKSLEMINSEGIVFRDISPDNVVLANDGKVKIFDFGTAEYTTISKSLNKRMVVKPGYSAEEQYRTKSKPGAYSDVYSVAATLYKMITGVTPPDAFERLERIEIEKRDILVEPHRINKKISVITENAILNALNIRIEDRTPTIGHLISDLSAKEPVKRIYGKAHRLKFYRIPFMFKAIFIIIFMIILSVGILHLLGVKNIHSYTYKMVSFDSNGGSSIPSIKYKYEEPFGDLPKPQKTGYEFVGWTYKGNDVLSDNIVTFNITLTAKWKLKTYSIHFNSDGGSEVSSYTRNYGELLGSFPNPHRDYYTFIGWYCDGDKVSSRTRVTKDMILVAKWEPNDWSDWSDWSNTFVDNMSINGLRVIEVQWKTHTAGYEPKYNYSRYIDYDGNSTGPYEGEWSDYYCDIYEETSSMTRFEYMWKRDGVDVFRDSNGEYWYNESVVKVWTPNSTEYRYRTRKI